MGDLPAFLTKDEFAEQLRVSHDYVDELIATGRIKSVRLSERVTRIPATELDRLAGFQAEAADGTSVMDGAA